MGLKELFTEIRKQVNEECLSNSCSGDGCRVYLTDVPPGRVIVNLECEFESRKSNKQRCDYILFYNDKKNKLVVVLIELKSGGFKALDVANQLQGGADFVTEVFEKLPQPAAIALHSFKVTCIPVLFHGRGIDKSQRYKLERAKVNFRGETMGIKKNKCGQPRNLASVL